jgi:hypothetical protein
VRVADHVGQDVAAACAAITAAGLVCEGRPRPGFAPPAQQVLTQTPAPGTMVPAGTTVAYEFYASAGVEVPNVQGLPVAAACQALTDAGLTCNRVGQANPGPEPVAPTTVWTGTIPAAGTRVGDGMSIRVVYENTPTTTVWELHENGKEHNELFFQDQAPAERAGWRTLKLGTVYRRPTGGTEAWYVHKATSIRGVADLLNTNPASTADEGPAVFTGYFARTFTQTGHYLCMHTIHSDSYYTPIDGDGSCASDEPQYPSNPGISQYLWP